MSTPDPHAADRRAISELGWGHLITDRRPEPRCMRSALHAVLEETDLKQAAELLLAIAADVELDPECGTDGSGALLVHGRRTPSDPSFPRMLDRLVRLFLGGRAVDSESVRQDVWLTVRRSIDPGDPRLHLVARVCVGSPGGKNAGVIQRDVVRSWMERLRRTLRARGLRSSAVPGPPPRQGW